MSPNWAKNIRSRLAIIKGLLAYLALDKKLTLAIFYAVGQIFIFVNGQISKIFKAIRSHCLDVTLKAERRGDLLAKLIWNSKLHPKVWSLFVLRASVKRLTRLYWRGRHWSIKKVDGSAQIDRNFFFRARTWVDHLQGHNQCDQIWQNFVALAKFSKTLAIFWGLILFWAQL